MTDTARILDAIEYIPPDDVSVWLAVGGTLKGLGFPLETWDGWSAGSTKHRKGECEWRWRRLTYREDGVAKMLNLARKHGWRGGRISPDELRERERKAERAAKVREEEAARDAVRHAEASVRMLRNTRPGISQYLVRKGIDWPTAPVDPDGRLYLPMKRDGRVVAVHVILPDGGKRKWPKGVRAAGSAVEFRKGTSGDTVVHVEGFADGWAVWRATRMPVNAWVGADFRYARGGIVLSDAGAVGEAAARASGLPWASAGRFGVSDPGECTAQQIRELVKCATRG